MICEHCGHGWKSEHPKELCPKCNKNPMKRHFCVVCGDYFVGEPGDHITGYHYEDVHGSDSMIVFEERHISGVD
jgi:predicted amidophosphoribosyltransferase